MGKSSQKKDHRKKVQARNERILQEKKSRDKIQREAIMKLIEEEKNRGLFENLPQINSPSVPNIQIEGPSI